MMEEWHSMKVALIFKTQLYKRGPGLLPSSSNSFNKSVSLIFLLY